MCARQISREFFPKASLMLGFCFRFSLKVPGSDTSCDDGDKKGFPFHCAAHRACDVGGGCRPGVRGWLDGGVGLAGGRRCGADWCARLAVSKTGWLAGRRLGLTKTALAGWGDGGVVQTGRARLAGNRP